MLVETINLFNAVDQETLFRWIGQYNTVGTDTNTNLVYQSRVVPSPKCSVVGCQVSNAGWMLECFSPAVIISWLFQHWHSLLSSLLF